MAGRRPAPSQAAAPSPDLDDETDDPQGPHSPTYIFRLLLDLNRGQATTAQAVRDLSAAVQLQGQKLDRIDDLRVELASHRTKLETASEDLRQVKQKLDRVHAWVIGAAAIVGFLVVLLPIALRLWPAHDAAPIAATATATPVPPPAR